MEEYTYLAKYYDQIMGEDWYKKWGYFITRFIKQKKLRPNLIIDAACGTGRLEKYLVGISQIIGFDNSMAMIKIARKKYRNSSNVKFYSGDFKNFSLPKNKKADIIACAFDSINYLRTKKFLRMAFVSFRKNLKLGGYLLFDVNGERVFFADQAIRRSKKVFIVDGDTIIWNNYFYPKKWRVIMEIFSKKGGKIVCNKEIHTEYYYAPNEIIEILKKSGFIIEGIFDNNMRRIKLGKNMERRYYFIAQAI